MENFELNLKEKIIFGNGAIKRISKILKKLNSQKVFIISGPHLNKIGMVEKISDICGEGGYEIDFFAETEPNPSIETVEKAAKKLSASKSDTIIALGGGSPIDTAKAAAVLAKCGGNITDYEGNGKVPKDVASFIAIPTTAGTGSEVTSFSVITDRSRNYKFTVSDDKLLPDYVILDPELITSVSSSSAAAAGMDAIVHAIESYISKGSNIFSKCMAEKALELLGSNIRRFVADRTNIEAAGAMLLGSTFAGIAFNISRLGDVHAMSHPVSGFFNVAHGIANSILLPACLEFNSLADNGKYKKIYEYISGIKLKEEFRTEMLVDEIKRLTASLGLAQRLSDVGVCKSKIPEMAADAMKSGNIDVNPRTTDVYDIEKLYEKSF